MSIQIKVHTPSRNYAIHIGVSLGDASVYANTIDGNQVCIVSQKPIFDLYGNTLVKALQQPNRQVDWHLMAVGEANKTAIEWMGIFDTLLNKQHNRTTTIIALGGGVVGDVAGFVAASYQRGVELIQVPTTLLAQVDSSVGGKTAINHPKGKNMIGAFYQPKMVVIDTQTLATLPNNELIAGLAEVIKYALLERTCFVDWLTANLPKLLQRDPAALQYAIAQSCQTKADIVAQDEKESGKRALLNLGHTFGHAIEAYTKYQDLLHGEAVAIGMCMAAKFSLLLGDLSTAEVDKIIHLIQLANLPTMPPTDMQVTDFMQLMQLDKKTCNQTIRLILFNSMGCAYINPDLSTKTISRLLQQIL